MQKVLTFQKEIVSLSSKYKKQNNMKRNLLIVSMAMMPMLACAYHAKIAGIYYNFSGEEAEVTYQSQLDDNPFFMSDYSGAVVIPETVTYNEVTYRVTRIGNFAFNGCQELTSVSIPESVTSIGGDAFYGCSGLTTITIPESVTSIASNTFEYCTGLTSVSIPNSISSIGESAFAYCSGLTSVNIPESVTRIGGFAFSACSNLKEFTVPETLTSIGQNAFYATTWYNAQPEGLVYVGKVAYRYKGVMPEGTQITIEEGTTGLADNAFKDCNCLEYIAIPETVKRIGKTTFAGCSNLTSICMPRSVTSIGGGAFEDCTGLQKVVVPNIAAWCGISFEDYTANPLYYARHIYSDEESEITDLFIPNGVTSISKAAFCNCSSLTYVAMPASVTSIGSLAFYGCKGLRHVLCLAETVPDTNSNAFNNLRTASVTLFVPEAPIEEYKTTSPWSGFGTIVAFIGDLNDDLKVDIADGVCVLEVLATDEYSEFADINGDGKVDIADFVAILNIMASWN